MTDIADIDLSEYDPKDVALIKTWAEFIADVVEVDPRTNGSRLRMGLDALVERADAVYPSVKAGGPVFLGVADMGERWTLPDELGDIFAGLTAQVLFLGDDGPRATAVALRSAISKITTRIAESRGYTVHPVAGEATDDNDESEGIV